MNVDDVPSVNVTNYLESMLLAMDKMKVDTHPFYKVVLEYPFDELVKKIWREQLVDIGTRKTVCKGLKHGVSNK